MTRKKFVKQLMALGYQRNEAEGLAKYARWGHWTYEHYLQEEQRSARFRSLLLDIQLNIVNHITPALKDAAETMRQLRMSLTDKGWRFAAENLAAIALDAAEQIHKQHPADALDALVYGIDLANGPDFSNVQAMSRADHAALHGFNTHVVLEDELDSQGGGGHE